MRLANLFDPKNSVRLLVTLVLALLFFVVVGAPASTLGGFYVHLDALTDNVRRADFEAAKTELDEVTGYYEASRAWGLQWFADDYLFRDAFLQRAAYGYLTGAYETVVGDLEGKIDDPRAAYLLGCAKFRIAQRRYRGITGADRKSEAQKGAIIQEVIELINADFERAIRGDRSDVFAYKWNYDLTSDADAIRRALELPKAAEQPELQQMKGEGTPVRRRRG